MDNDVTPTIHIAYCTDSNYLEYVATSIMSVVVNNLQVNLAFHVFVYDVSQEDIDKLKSTYHNINVEKINNEDIDKFQNEFKIKHINKSTYMRLAVPRLLQGSVKRFIYLDADTLCFRDISGIDEIDISDVICAVSHDALEGKESRHSKRLSLTSPYYFNAGFLYINIDKWIEHDIENKANAILFEKGNTLPYLDQDALNIAMEGHVKFIGNEWNYIFNWYSEPHKDTFFYDKKALPKIVHFTGGRKPWFTEHTGLSQDLFLFYHHLTPWAAEPLKSYASKMRPTDYRVYSRNSFAKHHYLAALKWYAKYLKSKLK
ncbi:glycosyltransferase family 8 protein [Enterobacter sp. ENT03]|uniref:glycosyltransferase family 8 protein n=1 Tax=Enterobacter sp. ENT03 TaxID=2854780 RepID=UPI001C48733A|nr:glycosyltransferase [Enterobacter sp. ENT03]MBV7404845.1 glycosyltransferase family 8 protein [Enterobacter sp. ENT03]